MIDLYDPSGKDIFEAKYIDATFDPKTRMYKQKFRPNDENDNRYIFRSYTSMKYLLNEWNENYFLKYTEQNYLYEGLIASYDIDTPGISSKDVLSGTSLILSAHLLTN